MMTKSVLFSQTVESTVLDHTGLYTTVATSFIQQYSS